MLNLGLSTADLAAFTKGLLSNHEMDIKIQVTDMSHNVTGDLSDYLLEGQVNVDRLADVTRSATLTLFDPRRTLTFDTNSPSDGALYMDRMIRIVFSVRSPNLYRWVDVPVFHGPITSASRDDVKVSVTAMGKEVLAKRPAWRTRTYGKGWARSSIIAEAMREVGENRFTFFDWPLKTTSAYSLTRETDVWGFVKSMAGGNRLFYDGRGYLVLQPPATRSVFTFAEGDNGGMVTYPSITYNTENVANAVLVKGGTPKGAKKALEYVCYAPRTHPLSKEALGRNGKPRILASIIEDTNLVKAADLKKRGDQALASALLQSVDATWESVPIPHLEAGDVVTLKTGEFAINVVLSQFSIPLKVGATQSNGYVARRTPNKARIRAKR